MSADDFVRSLKAEILGAPFGKSDEVEEKRIQQKQGGHHLPPHPDDGPPLDDTDRNSDKVIKPAQQEERLGKRHGPQDGA